MAAVVAVLLTAMIAQGQPAAAVEAEAIDPRPNAERPLTHEELLTIRGERERFATWGSTMLVAETVLERDQPLRPGDEWSGEVPAFGALPRARAHPGDPLVLASKAVSARYPADDGPVRGLLAISDSRSDALRLQGTVEMPAGAYLTPIETPAIAAAEALPVGALIVARGWLSSLPSSEVCPDVPDALEMADDREPVTDLADAQAKADQLAADAGVEIIGIVTITESGGQQPQPLYMDREMAMGEAMDTMASTPVLPGEVELSVSVLIQYEIA